MKKNTPEGMRDYLPDEAALRDEMIEKITGTYRSSGFRKISTPIIETSENLDGSDGGDNLKLIFRILKRGDKLEKAIKGGDAASLSDMGLRYDLTLPLARYYSNNSALLPDPFKCIQIGRVYRAERAQRGRMREFVQCDIDIIGSDSTDCEIELIMVTAEALKKLGITDFTVKLNNRSLIKNVIISAGFSEKQVNSVCISIDKLDKIGTDGVREELEGKGFDTAAIDRLMEQLGSNSDPEGYMSYEGSAQVSEIMKSVESISEGAIKTEFDITLVRGQGYYTGCVFEIVSKEFNGTIAGGGRYNGLVERFTGKPTPAVGFSIGFERIFTILSERGAVAQSAPRAAVIYNEGEIVRAMKYAGKLKHEYDVCLVKRKKQLGKQLNTLTKQGIAYAAVLGETDDWKKLSLKASADN